MLLFHKMSSSNELEPQNFRDRYQKEIFLCSVLGLKKKSSRISILPFKNKIKIFLKRIRKNINEIGLTIDFGAFSLNGQMYISENFFIRAFFLIFVKICKTDKGTFSNEMCLHNKINILKGIESSQRIIHIAETKQEKK